MAAPVFDLDGSNAIDQGSKYSKKFLFKSDGSPRDFSNMAVRAMVRESFEDVSPIVVFTAVIPSPETDGIIDISLGATNTVDLPTGFFIYDIELYHPSNPDDVERLIKGSIEITPEVTK
jgi:hypothetical protein